MSTWWPRLSRHHPVTAGSPQVPWLLTTPPGACLQSDWPELGGTPDCCQHMALGRAWYNTILPRDELQLGTTPRTISNWPYGVIDNQRLSGWLSRCIALLSTGRDAGFHSLWLSVCMKWHSCNCTGLSAKLKCISEVILDYSEHEIWMRMLIKSLFDRWKIHFDHWTHHDRFPWETFLPDWFSSSCFKWWRHQMETFSALLAICAGNSPVTGEFPAQRPVTRSVDIFFDLRMNERLNKQSWGWRFETPSRLLWRHCIANPFAARPFYG